MNSMLDELNDVIEKLRLYQELSDCSDEQDVFEEMIAVLNKTYNTIVLLGE
jgi:uncharacterized protein YejL (UPF0352 family)